MKRIVIISSVILISTLSSIKAQISIGPKFGINFSTIFNYNNDPADIKSSHSTRMQFGAVLGIHAGKVFSFQPEFLYISKGAKISDRDNSNIFSKININYFEIPLLAKFSFGGKFRGFFNVGPFVAIRLYGTHKYRYDPNDPIEQDVIEWDSEDMIVDAGLCIGPGASLTLGPGNLELDLRYELGVLGPFNIADEFNPNSTISISLAYLFNLGGKK